MSSIIMLKQSLRTPAQRLLVRSLMKTSQRSVVMIAHQTRCTPWCRLMANNNGIRPPHVVVPAVYNGAVRGMSQKIDTLRILTQRILEMDGSLSPKAWAGAETAFDMWTCHPVTSEGAEWGWKLLDRLVHEERQTHLQRLTVGWMHRMVGVYTELPVDPQQVMAKLEGYAPVLIVDEKTKSMLKEMEKRMAVAGGTEQPMELPTSEPVASFETNVNAPESVSVLEEDEPDEPEPAETSTQRMCSDKEWAEAEQRLMNQAGSNAFELLNDLIRSDPQRVTTAWLNRIVQAWCDNHLMEPSELLLKLNNYTPLPDASTYDIIVSAIRATSFLHQPVGSMTQADWNEAEARLQSLTSDAVTVDNISSAWKVLDRLMEEELYKKEQSKDYQSRLHPEWLNRIVEAWCRCSESGTTESSTAILVRMNRYAPHLTPDPYIYQLIVDSVSKAKDYRTHNVAKRERTNRKTEAKQHKKYDTGTAPKAITRHDRKSPSTTNPTAAEYHKKIKNQVGRTPRDCDPDKAENLLDEMWNLYKAGNLAVKPTTFTYNVVIKVWAASRNRQGGERAEALLREMQQLNDAGDGTVTPDLFTFTSCMAAWSNMGTPQGAEKAEALFRQMQAMYEAGDDSLKPDRIAYTALLTALSRSGDQKAGDRAEAILKEMQDLHDKGDKDVKPDTVSHNMVIKAFIHSHYVNRAERAERADAMLAFMEQKFAAGNENIKPNHFSFTDVITAWSRCEEIAQAGDRAEDVLNRMEAFYQAGNDDARPGRHAYNGVIAAHVRSGAESAAAKAESVLERMEKLEDGSIVPNEISFNMIIARLCKTRR